jgi:hypothetical protein
MKIKFDTLQAVSVGFFFGSILGRTFLGYWITAIAALGFLIGIFGYRLTKTQSSEK